MSEFQTKALATVAGLAVGVGGTAAGNVLHLDFASAQPAPQERVADSVNPALPRFGGSLVFSEGQFASRPLSQDQVTNEFANSSKAHIAGNKSQWLAKHCGHQANINLGTHNGDRDNRDPYISSSVVIRKSGKNTYKYALHKGAKFCGLQIMRVDNKMVYPEPTKKNRTNGYYTDSKGNSLLGVSSIAFFAKAPRKNR